MAYNWRSAFWDPNDQMIYGINGKSGYVFRFDPKARTVEVLERISSEPSKRSGMYDRFNYGYMGFTLGPDGHTIYYLAGAPGAVMPGRPGSAPNPQRRADDCHFITYDLTSGKYTDHGALVLEDGQHVAAPQSIAVGKDGSVYTLSYVTRNGKRGIELIGFHP